MNCLCNLSSLMLEAEVSRLVRLRPEEVCHIPRALDFFLTKEVNSILFQLQTILLI